MRRSSKLLCGDFAPRKKSARVLERTHTTQQKLCESFSTQKHINTIIAHEEQRLLSVASYDRSNIFPGKYYRKTRQTKDTFPCRVKPLPLFQSLRAPQTIELAAQHSLHGKKPTMEGSAFPFDLLIALALNPPKK